MLIRAKKILAGPEGVARPGEVLEVSEGLGQALLEGGDAVRVDASAPAAKKPAPAPAKVESAKAPEAAETTKAPQAGKTRGR